MKTSFCRIFVVSVLTAVSLISLSGGMVEQLALYEATKGDMLSFSTVV